MAPLSATPSQSAIAAGWRTTAGTCSAVQPTRIAAASQAPAARVRAGSSSTPASTCSAPATSASVARAGVSGGTGSHWKAKSALPRPRAPIAARASAIGTSATAVRQVIGSSLSQVIESPAAGLS